MKNKPYRLIFLLILLVPGLWGITHQVSMVGLNFVPETLSIQVGDTVNWKNNSTMNHTTTSGVNGVPDGIWDSGLMVPGDSFRFAFSISDSYPYYCTPHWQLGMVGLIIARATAIEEGNAHNSEEVNIGVVPNPFRGSTTIKFPRLPGAPDLNFQVYDLRGNMIRFMESNRWDGNDERGLPVPPGVYFIKPETGNPVSVRKVVKLK